MIEPILAVIDPFSLLIYAGVSAATSGIMAGFSRNQAQRDAARLERQRLDAERAAALEEGATEKFLQQLRAGDISRAKLLRAGLATAVQSLAGVKTSKAEVCCNEFGTHGYCEV